MKALEKDRNRRYETANAFAADVQALTWPTSRCWPVHRVPATGCANSARRNKGSACSPRALPPAQCCSSWQEPSAGWRGTERPTAGETPRRSRPCSTSARMPCARPGRADRAALALGAAEGRAADGGAERLADRLARCRADLGLLGALDDIDTFRWTWADRGLPEPKAVAARWRAARWRTTG